MASAPGGLYRPFERLVKITVLGKTVEVPENNILLRAFQFVCPDTIPYGRFCWNEDCQYCRCTVKGLDGRERIVLSCKVLVREGLEITWMDQELVNCLRNILVTSDE
jgi:NADH dehydrogenase/NADH:ubiquinone oxidoreductase subunit G